MMRNLRFRNSASIALYNNKHNDRPRKLRWFVLSLFLATSSLYGAFQLNRSDEHLRLKPPPLETVDLPIRSLEEPVAALSTEPANPIPETVSR
jgi:hypothetical protein